MPRQAADDIQSAGVAFASRIPVPRALRGPRALVQRARRTARRSAVRRAKRLGERFGFEVVPDTIYSPIPTVPPPDDPIWSREASGIEIDEERQFGLLAGPLSPYVEEFTREVRGRGFKLWNGFYAAGDAETLYALVRHLRPRRILEIGSGFSTIVSAAACARNAEEGSPASLVAVDPHPRTELRDGAVPLARVELRDCRELPIERFTELEDGDVLFIDSSHAVKLGSEVNWLFLEVLPQLNAGVYVHVHDIFLPYEYPRYLFELGACFNEQYLLHALLRGSDDWEIVLALGALARREPGRLAAHIPSLHEDVPPGFRYLPTAFWTRRRLV